MKESQKAGPLKLKGSKGKGAKPSGKGALSTYDTGKEDAKKKKVRQGSFIKL